MRKFVDLHLCVPLEDPKILENMILKSCKLGYKMVGVPFPPNITKNKINCFRDVCKNIGVDLVSRVDLTPKTTKELLANLRSLRRKFEVIAVTCTSKAVARQAAKDRRVDLLSFPTAHRRGVTFDNAEAELASVGVASFEIDMMPLLSLSGVPRIRLLSALRKQAAVARKFGIPIVISSGAPDTYYMRSPRDFIAVTTLFDMPITVALDAISNVPFQIVKRNREKLSPKFVAPGVRIVKVGKNCRAA